MACKQETEISDFWYYEHVIIFDNKQYIKMESLILYQNELWTFIIEIDNYMQQHIHCVQYTLSETQTRPQFRILWSVKSLTVSQFSGEYHFVCFCPMCIRAKIFAPT